MTPLQSTALVAVLAVAVAAAIYEAREASQARAELQALRQHQMVLAEQNRQLLRERDEAANRLARLAEASDPTTGKAELLKLRAEIARLSATGPPPVTGPLPAEANAWIARVGQLRKYLEQNPDKAIPELQLLTPGDWLSAGREPDLDDEISRRKALSRLRLTAKSRFSPLLYDALARFRKANEGRFPTDIAQLTSYFEAPPDDAILARYAVIPASDINNSDYHFPNADLIIAEKAPADVEYDSRVVVGPNGRSTSDFDGDTLIPVFRAFEAANPGVPPGDLGQLLPYATTPDQQAAVRRSMERLRASRR